MTHCVCLSILRWSGAETKILDATPQHLFVFPVAVAAPPSPLERSLDPADDGHHPADLVPWVSHPPHHRFALPVAVDVAAAPPPADHGRHASRDVVA